MGFSIEKMRSERFKGKVSFTDLGIVVSTFDGENQHLMIVSGDQSGRREILAVYAPVDSPLIVDHTICKGRSLQERKDGITRDIDKIINEKVDAFLGSIPSEAVEIIKNNESWEWTRY